MFADLMDFHFQLCMEHLSKLNITAESNTNFSTSEILMIFFENFHNSLNSKPLPENSILTPIDITALCTNIPQIYGLAAVEHFLDTRNKGTLPTTCVILDVTKFILEKNNFQIQDYTKVQPRVLLCKSSHGKDRRKLPQKQNYQTIC